MLCLHCTMPDGSSAQHPFWLWEAGFYLWFSVGSPTRQRNKKARPPQSLLVMGDVGISRCPQSLGYSCHGHGNGTESAIPCCTCLQFVRHITVTITVTSIQIENCSAYFCTP